MHSVAVSSVNLVLNSVVNKVFLPVALELQES